MAKLTINRGSTANDGTGDNLRDGANKVNLNFDEIYTAIGDGTTVNGTIKVADDSSTVMTLSANGETIRLLGGSGITSTISGNDLTLAVDGTVLTSSAVSTLTNKSIALSVNTITGTTAEFNTALTDNDFATLAGTEALTNKTVAIGSNTITGTALTITGDDSSATSLSIGDNILFTGGSGITTSISGNEITFATDGAVVTETSTDTLTNKTINGPDNTLTNIANGSLANSAVTLGATSVSLGATAAAASNFNITGSSSLSGTGTVDTTGSGNKLRFNFANTGSLPAAATYEGMFAYDVGGNDPYVADAGGWVKLISENSSIADISNVGSIASITNGQVLVWNSSGGRFDPGSALVYPLTTFSSTGIDDNADATAITINSSEQVEFTAGTALLPAITKTGDANTGMWFPAADTIAFSEGGSEAMRIDTSGNLLVGKTSANTATVGVEFRSFGLGVFTRSGNEPIIANRTDNDGKILQLQKDGTEVGSIGVNASDNIYISGNSSHAGIQFGTSSAIAFKNGSIVNNTLDLGASTHTWKDIYLGGGAYIGGTAAANKLDDYEEGTFTPSFSDAGGGSYEYSSQTGNYTKIGNTVFISGYLITSGAFRTGGSGNVLLNGLPFAMTAGNFGGIQTLHSYGSWGDTPLGAEITSSGTSCNIFYRDTADGGRQRLQASDISISAYVLMQFTGFYKTA